MAAHAIADVIPDSELTEDYIIPSVFNRDVVHGGGRLRRRGGSPRRCRARGSSRHGVPLSRSAEPTLAPRPAGPDENRPSAPQAVTGDLHQARVAVVVDREGPDHAAESWCRRRGSRSRRAGRPCRPRAGWRRAAGHRGVPVGGIGVRPPAELGPVLAQEALPARREAGAGPAPRDVSMSGPAVAPSRL